MTIRVGLVGAGYIAGFHLAALSRIGGVKVVAVCDSVSGRADALRTRGRFDRSYESLDTMLQAGNLDVVHVLVPPASHAAVAARCLEARCHVFVEKPLAVADAEGRRLLETAGRVGRRVGTNHNLLFHPAFLRMVDAIRHWSFGRIRHVASFWNVPLRQLRSGQFDHWMFASTGNIVLEQAIHPLSQIQLLVGNARSIAVLPSRGIDLPNGVRFVDNWQIALECESGTAACTLNFSGGLPQSWLYAVGDDAAGFADFNLNTFVMTRQTHFSSPLDEFLRGAMAAGMEARQSASQLAGRVAEILRLRPDLFTRTIESSIRSFYRSLSDRNAHEDGARAVHLVGICEQMARLAIGKTTTPEAVGVV